MANQGDGGLELSPLSTDMGSYAPVNTKQQNSFRPASVGAPHPVGGWILETPRRRNYCLVLLAIVLLLVIAKRGDSSSQQSPNPDAPSSQNNNSNNKSDSNLVREESYKLLAGDGATMDLFGMAVALDKNTLVIGAPSADTSGFQDSGRAYVYTKENHHFELAQELVASNPSSKVYFGVAVAVLGDTIAIGAPYTSDDKATQNGSVYIFTRNNNDNKYHETQILTASDGQDMDWFGWSLAMTDDTLVIGAPYDDNGGSQQGSVYIFGKNDNGNWIQQQILWADDAADNDKFGSQLAISGTTIAVGVSDDSDQGALAGSVYIFEKMATTWRQTQQLYANDGIAGDGFGSSVALQGDTLVVGANLKERPLPGMSGSAYVFVRSNGVWKQSQTLRASDSTGDPGMFGECVSISENRLVIGDSEMGMPGSQQSGHAYVFEFDGTAWRQSLKLKPSDPSEDHRFGRIVNISGETVVVSAFLDSDGGSEKSGSTYVYEM